MKYEIKLHFYFGYISKILRCSNTFIKGIHSEIFI